MDGLRRVEPMIEAELLHAGLCLGLMCSPRWKATWSLGCCTFAKFASQNWFLFSINSFNSSRKSIITQKELSHYLFYAIWICFHPVLMAKTLQMSPFHSIFMFFFGLSSKENTKKKTFKFNFLQKRAKQSQRLCNNHKKRWKKNIAL
jgi:hypothetical protein